MRATPMAASRNIPAPLTGAAFSDAKGFFHHSDGQEFGVRNACLGSIRMLDTPSSSRVSLPFFASQVTLVGSTKSTVTVSLSSSEDSSPSRDELLLRDFFDFLDFLDFLDLLLRLLSSELELLLELEELDLDLDLDLLFFLLLLRLVDCSSSDRLTTGGAVFFVSCFLLEGSDSGSVTVLTEAVFFVSGFLLEVLWPCWPPRPWSASLASRAAFATGSSSSSPSSFSEAVTSLSPRVRLSRLFYSSRTDIVPVPGACNRNLRVSVSSLLERNNIKAGDYVFPYIIFYSLSQTTKLAL